MTNHWAAEDATAPETLRPPDRLKAKSWKEDTDVYPAEGVSVFRVRHVNLSGKRDSGGAFSRS